jgi:hypothetical protein
MRATGTLTEDAFVALVNGTFPDRPEPLEPHDRLAVALDDFGMFRLYALLDQLAPGFAMPEQFDVVDMRLHDAWYYLTLDRERKP